MEPRNRGTGPLPVPLGDTLQWLELARGSVGDTLDVFEQGGSIVVDVIVHPDVYELTDIGASRPARERWTVDISTAKSVKTC
ncbi:hypothetical protein ACQP2U_23535 [Nocardia sp. CA-084685]|uniref:hypothetical protein n=1 Tax=Nocardia sp. CA-084685 TaxID=3239970 RepID=UPI003D9936FE